MNIKIGDTNTASVMVSDANTATALVSGTLDVFATPSMIALMEQAAAEYLDTVIDNHLSSVGVMVNINHLMATPIGESVQATAVVTGVDGLRVSFEIMAETPAGLIGAGTHDRFIIDKEKFMEKTKNQKSV